MKCVGLWFFLDTLFSLQLSLSLFVNKWYYWTQLWVVCFLEQYSGGWIYIFRRGVVPVHTLLECCLALRCSVSMADWRFIQSVHLFIIGPSNKEPFCSICSIWPWSLKKTEDHIEVQICCTDVLCEFTWLHCFVGKKSKVAKVNCV